MIEDNATDAYLSKEILSESEHIDYNVTILRDGVEALAYLQRSDGRRSTTNPALILLDLDLPRMHGFDLLSRIKTDPEMEAIPVCILTTSQASKDIEKAKDLKADCYFVKPLDLKKFEETFFPSIPGEKARQ